MVAPSGRAVIAHCGTKCCRAPSPRSRSILIDPTWIIDTLSALCNPLEGLPLAPHTTSAHLPQYIISSFLGSLQVETHQAPPHYSELLEMCEAESRKSILEILPTELLAVIRSNIPQEDLRTNVCFYNTCPRFASLFGSEMAQNTFWEGACLLSGLGCLPGELPRRVSWKSIALDVIERDGFCDHPECGGNRLESNGTYFSDYPLAHVLMRTQRMKWPSYSLLSPTGNTLDLFAGQIRTTSVLLSRTRCSSTLLSSQLTRSSLSEISWFPRTMTRRKTPICVILVHKPSCRNRDNALSIATLSHVEALRLFTP